MIGWFYLSYTNHCGFVVFTFKYTVQFSDMKHIFKTDDLAHNLININHKINLKEVYLIPLIVHLKWSINSILV